MTNLVCLEALDRRLETLECQYKERVREGDRGAMGSTAALSGQSGEMDLFEGGSHVSSTICCAPNLVEHVPRELEEEARAHKETRTTREGRALMRQMPSPGEESGKGGGGKKRWSPSRQAPRGHTALLCRFADDGVWSSLRHCCIDSCAASSRTRGLRSLSGRSSAHILQDLYCGSE